MSGGRLASECGPIVPSGTSSVDAGTAAAVQPCHGMRRRWSQIWFGSELALALALTLTLTLTLGGGGA